MKHVFHAAAAAAVLALVAGNAMAQTTTPAPATNAPAASAPATTKELGEMKQTPAEKKAEHDKNRRSATGNRSAKHVKKKQQSAAAPEAGKHVDKKVGDGVASEPAKKL